MGEQVAVIGGTGFLGANIVAELLNAGYTPIVVARHPEKAAAALPDVRVEARYSDITDPGSLRAALHSCAYVHAVAAMASELYTRPSPEKEAGRYPATITLALSQVSLDLEHRDPLRSFPLSFSGFYPIAQPADLRYSV